MTPETTTDQQQQPQAGEIDPSCPTMTYESDVARAFRLAAKSQTFDEWFEVICDDIPMGGKLTGGELRSIAKFCWEHGQRITIARQAEQIERLEKWAQEENDHWSGRNADRYWQMQRVLYQLDTLAALEPGQ